MSMKARGEEGFTMIMTVIGTTLVVLLAAVAVVTVNGDAQTSGRDISRKQAYEAALAGINEYAFHLHSNSNYWAECLKAVPSTEQSALNNKGSTLNRRSVPGVSGATYALELIPTEGHAACDPTSYTTARESMIQTAKAVNGTFLIRATGYSGQSKASITATFKPGSFLDYVYFTQRETSDPVTYGIEELIKAANRQCSKTLAEGRNSIPLENEKGQYLTSKGTTTSYLSQADWCDTISFVTGDNIKGPMHTNDAFVICNSPILGRTAADPIEVSSGSPGWYSTNEMNGAGSNCSGNPNFKGTFRINSPVLNPPENNGELEKIAETTFRFSGENTICLEGTKLTVWKGLVTSCSSTAANKVYSGAFPANGVIYDSNKTCTSGYSPFVYQYSPGTIGTCGTVNVKGTYSKPLTIAAANDVLIVGNLEKTNEEGMLGLIANNFIRVYHPISIQYPTKCVGSGKNRECYEDTTQEPECGGNASSGDLSNPKIEAALLAIAHSFIVDNYNCGSQLGTLSVIGAIAQKYRGAVGTTGNSGYLKNYEYDERLRTTEPPSFLEPTKSDWVIGRETTE
jgi:hypothetical protein